MQSSSSVVDKILESITPVLRAHRDEGEALRRVAPASAEALIESGAFRACTPKSLGGLEIHPAEAFRMVESIAQVDAGAAWCVGNSIGQAYMTMQMPDAGVEEIFASPRAVLAGGGFPPAHARPVEGGFRLTGQAPFSSGIHCASWVFALAMVMDGDTPRLGPGGAPDTILCAFPIAEARIVDTWHTMGMRSSGSHDVAYTDVFVPAHRTTPLTPFDAPGEHFQAPLYRSRIWGIVQLLPATALGVARASMDSAQELMKRKTPNFVTKPLIENTSSQRLLGRAEAKLRAARAFLLEATNDLAAHTEAGGFAEPRHGINMQLASSHALEACREVTEIVHEIAGTTGFREDGPFDRHFRDAHTLSQHAFASPARFESAAQAMLGLESDWAFFSL